MKDKLAEELLAKVMDWNQQEVATERPVLQALAAYKYDEYQQFSAGSRFLENLSLWLSQFRTPAERREAYDFVKRKLIFFSAAEIRHLVELAYPDHIRPHLIERVAGPSSARYRPRAVATSEAFKVRCRQTLFLGLSDGARIDAFRRANPDLNQEQIWQTYELSEQKVGKLLEKLGEHLQGIKSDQVSPSDCRFRTLVFLDDFSASGTSYYAEPATNPPGGKIAGFFSDLCDTKKPVSRLVSIDDVEVIIVLYLATEQAYAHLIKASEATWGRKGIPHTVEVVQRLSGDLRLAKGDGASIGTLIDHADYYDHEIHDVHFEKGGTVDARYGYAKCGLPVVLHHNTPNNSIALLMSYERLKFRGLFPRVQRHREMS